MQWLFEVSLLSSSITSGRHLCVTKFLKRHPVMNYSVSNRYECLSTNYVPHHDHSNFAQPTCIFFPPLAIIAATPWANLQAKLGVITQAIVDDLN